MPRIKSLWVYALAFSLWYFFMKYIFGTNDLMGMKPVYYPGLIAMGVFGLIAVPSTLEVFGLRKFMIDMFDGILDDIKQVTGLRLRKRKLGELAPGIPRPSSILVQMVAAKMLASVERLKENNWGTEWKWTSANKLVRIEFQKHSDSTIPARPSNISKASIRLRKTETERWTELTMNNSELDMLESAAAEACRLFYEKQLHANEMAVQNMAIDYIEILMDLPTGIKQEYHEDDFVMALDDTFEEEDHDYWGGPR